MKIQHLLESERLVHPDVSYEDETDKVIAKLKSYNSATYTKLANRVEEISRLESEIKALKEEVKSIARQDVAGLFNADDAVKTRVVDTISVIITLSKDPKPTETYKYAEIFQELEAHLTPELIKVLADIKEKYKKITPKEPSFKVQRKESLDEVASKIAAFFNKYFDAIRRWGRSYDRKLNALKSAARSA